MVPVRLALGLITSSFIIAAQPHPALAQKPIRPDDAQFAAAELAITEPALRGHIRFLADDLLEGRGPARVAMSWLSTISRLNSNRWV